MQTYVPRCVTDISPWNWPDPSRGLGAARRQRNGLRADGLPTLTAGHQAFSLILSESCDSNPDTEGHYTVRFSGRLGSEATSHRPRFETFKFLCLPGMEFLNIIFCSLPGIGASRLLPGVDGSCPVVTNHASTMAPTNLGRGFCHGPKRRSFFCECDFQGPRTGCAFVSFEGGW